MNIVESLRSEQADSLSQLQSQDQSPARRMSSIPSPSASLPTNKTNISILTCAFLAALTTGGTTYAFGLYGATLKHTLHLSQSQLDTISSANFCAGLLSWVPGLCVDKFGPRWSMSSGGLIQCVALLLYWVVARQFVPVARHLLVPTLSALGVFIFASSALITGSVFKLIVMTAQKNKGTAVGAAKGYVGLGAGAYACLFEALRSSIYESDLDFLPMAAFFAITAATLPALLLLPGKQELLERYPTSTDKKQNNQGDATTPIHFRALYIGLAALATLVVVTSIMQLESTTGQIPHSKGGDGGGGDTTNATATVMLAALDVDPSVESFSKLKHTHDGRHLFRALLILTAWWGPILSFLCWPTAKYSQVPLETNDVEEDAEEGTIPIVKEQPQDVTVHQDNDEEEEEAVLDSLLVTSNQEDNDDDDESHCHHAPPTSTAPTTTTLDNKEFALFEMLQTLPAWLFVWTALILVGGGTLITNNTGQMVEALHFPAAVAPASLALFSVAQSGGRVITGAISESALSWNTASCKCCGTCCCGCYNKNSTGVPRPAFLIVASLVGVLAHLVLAITTHEVTFIIGVACAGVAFGMVWPLMVLVVGEVFGTAHHGANYMFFDGFTSAMGTLLLSKFVAQEVYEDHIDHHHSTEAITSISVGDNNDGLTCYGSACFRASHLIVSFLSMTCVISSVALMYTTRSVYQRRQVAGIGQSE